ERVERPLVERRPFFGLLPAVLGHPDAALRAAAVRVLGGARGVPGLQRLVAALNDPDAPVRLAAVEALRESLAGFDGSRWVHVLFHPSADVRRAGIAAGLPCPAPFWYRVFLLADPVCRDSVMGQLRDAVPTAEELPQLLAEHRRGMVPTEPARVWVARTGWQGWLAYLGTQANRTGDIS